MSTVVARSDLLSAAERLRVRKLSERLKRYFKRIVALEWDFSADGRACVAVCRVHSASGYYRAKTQASRFGEAADLAFDHLVRQRRRARGKRATRRRPR